MVRFINRGVIVESFEQEGEATGLAEFFVLMVGQRIVKTRKRWRVIDVEIDVDMGQVDVFVVPESARVLTDEPD